jgi:hypothetical protein
MQDIDLTETSDAPSVGETADEEKGGERELKRPLPPSLPGKDAPAGRKRRIGVAVTLALAGLAAIALAVGLGVGLAAPPPPPGSETKLPNEKPSPTQPPAPTAPPTTFRPSSLPTIEPPTSKPVAGQPEDNCTYPLEIYVYKNQDQCLNRETPSAVGRLYADRRCRATEVTSQQNDEAALLLPGQYSAVCRRGEDSDSLGQVEFMESGCISDTCFAAALSNVCDRDTGPASFYSRLDPPLYTVQDASNTSSFTCLQLRSDSTSFFFAIFGDCSASAC